MILNIVYLYKMVDKKKFGQVHQLLSTTEKCIKHIKKNINEEKLHIIDAGFNVGQYSFMINKHILKDNNYIIHAFEPMKALFNYRGGLTDKTLVSKNIYLYNVALGNVMQKMELMVPIATNSESGDYETQLKSKKRARDGGVYGISTLSEYRKDVITNDLVRRNIFWIQTESVDVITLDSFCDKLNIKEIHWIKIDVEGFTKELLDGCLTLLKNKKIYGGVIENNPNFNQHKIQKYLLNFDYSIINNNMEKVSSKFLKVKQRDYFFLRIDLI